MLVLKSSVDRPVAADHSRNQRRCRSLGTVRTRGVVSNLHQVVETVGELRLIGCWQLQLTSNAVNVPRRQQRLLAALAIHGERPRSFLSGILWPDSSAEQAASNLRNTVWHVTHELPGVLAIRSDVLSLAPGIEVDVLATRQHAGMVSTCDLAFAREYLRVLQSIDLLPGWYEDWVVAEQNRLRLLCLGALDVLADRLLSQGEAVLAASAAAAANAIDPYRESSQRLLMKAHMSVGNHVAALQVYRAFKAKLEDELCVKPSAGLIGLARQLTADPEDLAWPNPVMTDSHSRTPAGPFSPQTKSGLLF